MKGKASGIPVDFSGAVNIPEGDYSVKVKKVEKKTSEASKKDYLNWELAIVDGPLAGRTIYHITSLQPHALIGLKNVLEALGVEIKEKMTIVPASYVGLTMGVTVAHEKADGKVRVRVADVFSLTDEEEEEGDEEEDSEESDDEDSEDEEVEEVDEEEDSEDDEESDDEEEESDDEDEDSDEDEEDEEEEPAPKKKPSAKASAKAPAKPAPKAAPKPAAKVPEKKPAKKKF